MDPIMVYEQAGEMIAREIQKLLDKGNIDKDTLCLIGEAVDIQKDLESLKMLQYQNEGSSYDNGSNYSNRNYRYSNRRSYDNSWETSNNGLMSRDNGMSGHNSNKNIIYKLEDAMNMAEDRQTREAIRMVLDKIEKM